MVHMCTKEWFRRAGSNIGGGGEVKKWPPGPRREENEGYWKAGSKPIERSVQSGETGRATQHRVNYVFRLRLALLRCANEKSSGTSNPFPFRWK